MEAVDTSLLYALFNEDDSWHAEAKNTFRKRRPILVPPGILQETLELLRVRHSAARALQAHRWLESQPMIVLESQGADQSHAQAIEIYRRSPGSPGARRPGFADIWCVTHAHLHAASLATKDQAQARLFKTLQT